MGDDRSDRQVSFILDDENLEYFEACARIRDISTKSLINRLMRTIASDQLVLAILDDGSKREHLHYEHRWKDRDGH